MVVPMLRPDVFGALASHAGDALFEACYLPEFPQVARLLRDEFDGDWDTFFARAADRRSAEAELDLAARGLRLRGVLLARPGPPRPRTDPVRRPRPPDRRRLGAMAGLGPGADGGRPTKTHCKSMHRIYLDAGRSDEYYLDLGAQAFAAELDKLDVPHTLELFDGTHARLTYRYPGAIRELITALSPRAHASTAGHGP